MAALDTPWITSMSTSERSAEGGSQPSEDPNPPTTAAFSPVTLGRPLSSSTQRSTILIHQKSPLLVATPPQITRALAYSHPFILPLNTVVGLLTWTTGDPWESYLMVASFWMICLYGDLTIRWAGPIVVVVGLILGMYSRRHSPLSSTGWTGEKAPKGHKRGESETLRHHKSLDEIVDALKLFTSRCNILLDPLLRLTDFLSTQRTATSATTRPALTTLFIRILFVMPIWIILTLPPLYIITTKRVVLTIGTLVLSWHSRPARVSRTILWRSKTIRSICRVLTGLQFGETVPIKDALAPPLPPRKPKDANQVAASLAAKRKSEVGGIRFTFTLYENQRRWLGIGWTSSMLAYERAPWTDEQGNPAPPKERFQLPEVEGGHAKWRWVEGGEWSVEGAEDEDTSRVGGNKVANGNGNGGWIYYDNKWRDGKRGQDGWGRYTRRRKWYRDAELVEITPSMESTPIPTPNPKLNPTAEMSDAETEAKSQQRKDSDDNSAILSDEKGSIQAMNKKKTWFRRTSRAASEKSASGTANSRTSYSSAEAEERQREEEDVYTPLRHRETDNAWGFDESRMGLG